jgi:hypothetical protein
MPKTGSWKGELEDIKLKVQMQLVNGNDCWCSPEVVSDSLL